MDQHPPPTTAQDRVLNELSTVLEKLDSTPSNVPLLKEQIHLMRKLKMSAEVLDASLHLSTLVMLSEDDWIAHLDSLISSRPIDLEAFVNILERFERAEQDYLSLPILLRHIEFLIGASRETVVATTSGEPLHVDPDVQAFLEPEALRGMLRSVVTKGNGLLTESHLLWQPWIDWEMGHVSTSPDSVHELFALRMTIPHATMDQTSALYSTFCSDHCPTEYEQRLVSITALAQSAKFKWSGERRFGKTREVLEQELSDPSTFTSYIDWETDPRAQNPKSDKHPSTDTDLTRSIFERAIAFYARAASAADAALFALPRSKKNKGKEREGIAEVRLAHEQTLAAYKTVEAGLWERYAQWTSDPNVRERAIRACPSVGMVWRNYMNQLEHSGSDNQHLEGIFSHALDLGMLTAAPELSDVFVCRVASLNRLGLSDQVPNPILQIARQGFENIGHISRSGDPTLRLEKFLLDWGESRGQDHLDEILGLLAKPLKSRSSTYQMIIMLAHVQARNGLVSKARDTFKNGVQRTDLDWPEAVHEAFIQFETVYGDLESLNLANTLINAEQAKLTRRREKETKQAAQDHQVAEPPTQEVGPNAGITEADNHEAPTTSLKEPTNNDHSASGAIAAADDGHFKR